jgi:hypothetical protein
MQRKATAVWMGDLKGGKGSPTSHSGVLKQTQFQGLLHLQQGPGGWQRGRGQWRHRLAKSHEAVPGAGAHQ